MNDTVVPFRNGPAASARRQQFLDHIAMAFDEYVEKCGYEPDALVHVLCGIKQTSSAGWTISGESEEGWTSVKALAAVHLMAEVTSGLTDSP